MNYRPTWDLTSIPDELLYREAGRRNGSRSPGRRGQVSCKCGECAVCKQRMYRQARRKAGKDLPGTSVQPEEKAREVLSQSGTKPKSSGPKGGRPKKTASTRVIVEAIGETRLRAEGGDASVPATSVLMIGHSNVTWPVFAELLTAHQVSVLIDVRSVPRSRFCPQFNRDTLAAQLAEIGIEYRHAPELGGRDPRPAPELHQHVARLLPVAPGTCLMCSEGDFHECHRHRLLAPLFLELGIEVRQILPDGSVVADPGPAPQLAFT